MTPLVAEPGSLVRQEPTALETIKDIKAGHLSPLDVLDASLARIEQVEPRLNALPVVCAERARSSARKLADAATASGQWPPLCGLPLAVKDNADLSGVPTSGGSALMAKQAATLSDPAIMALEANGAVAVAKSNLSELGGANTTNRLFGTTFNPHALTLTAGGSSGGSAAALAAGEVFFGHGNDVGGSLRTPAAFCGVAGLRPTPGVVPRKPMSDPFDVTFVEGPMARTVCDLALMLDAMTGIAVHDPLSREPRKVFLQAAQAPMVAPRIAVSPDLGFLPVERSVRADFASTCAQLCRLGAEVEEATPDLADIQRVIDVLRGLSYAMTWRDYWPGSAADFTVDVQKDIVRGHTLSGLEIAEAMALRAMMFRKTLAFFSRYDVLVCPTAQVRPFAADTLWPSQVDGYTCENYMHWLAITYAWSILGLPALAVPVGKGPDGLPVSVQIVGPPRSESRLLSFGALLESEVRLRSA